MEAENKIYDTLKQKISDTVSPLIADRETARTRLNELRKQVDGYAVKASELSGELALQEAQFPKTLIDSPDDVPALQKKIEKLKVEINNQADYGNRLEALLPAIELELQKRESDVSSATSAALNAESKVQSEIAGELFSALLAVYVNWNAAVLKIRTATRSVGLDPFHSNRLSIYKTIMHIPAPDKILWHKAISKNIQSDFAMAGSHSGDL